MRLTIEVISERDGDSCLTSLVAVRQKVSGSVLDWVHELVNCGALGEPGVFKRMANGERVRQRLKVRLWSHTWHGYYGDEYDSGLDVLSERTYKRHRGLSDKAWHRKNYRAGRKA
ncbi:hypothetical protein [Chromobacterium phragmitis]|uniref:Uncharacterized protein n=1 Tax=Chromobacterium phragmitis TaxID=2202141 RepID=A0ABV0J0Q0_9NEIS